MQYTRVIVKEPTEKKRATLSLESNITLPTKRSAEIIRHPQALQRERDYS